MVDFEFWKFFKMNSMIEMKDVKWRIVDCINFMVLCKLILFENEVEVLFCLLNLYMMG